MAETQEIVSRSEGLAERLRFEMENRGEALAERRRTAEDGLTVGVRLDSSRWFSHSMKHALVSVTIKCIFECRIVLPAALVWRGPSSHIKIGDNSILLAIIRL